MRLGLLALLASGCVEDYCKHLAERTEACSGQEVPASEIASCREDTVGCTAQDQQILIESFDCIEDAGISVCGGTTTTSDPELLGASFACVSQLAGLSEDCDQGSVSLPAP